MNPQPPVISTTPPPTPAQPSGDSFIAPPRKHQRLWWIVGIVVAITIIGTIVAMVVINSRSSGRAVADQFMLALRTLDDTTMRRLADQDRSNGELKAIAEGLEKSTYSFKSQQSDGATTRLVYTVNGSGSLYDIHLSVMNGKITEIHKNVDHDALILQQKEEVARKNRCLMIKDIPEDTLSIDDFSLAGLAESDTHRIYARTFAFQEGTANLPGTGNGSASVDTLVRVATFYKHTSTKQYRFVLQVPSQTGEVIPKSSPLTMQRFEKIKSELVRFGVDASRIDTVNLDPSEPASDMIDLLIFIPPACDGAY